MTADHEAAASLSGHTDEIEPTASELGVEVERAPYSVLEFELTGPDGNRLRIGALLQP